VALAWRAGGSSHEGIPPWHLEPGWLGASATSWSSAIRSWATRGSVARSALESDIRAGYQHHRGRLDEVPSGVMEGLEPSRRVLSLHLHRSGKAAGKRLLPLNLPTASGSQGGMSPVVPLDAKIEQVLARQSDLNLEELAMVIGETRLRVSGAVSDLEARRGGGDSRRGG
jgi:hypothetical protein